MQEIKLRGIERNGCWFAFWALLAAMMIQLVLGAEVKQMAGEWIVFMCLALYIGIACMRAGIWDRHIPGQSDLFTDCRSSSLGAEYCRDGSQRIFRPSERCRNCCRSYRGVYLCPLLCCIEHLHRLVQKEGEKAGRRAGR